MPKAQLHAHALGSMKPETIIELSRKNLHEDFSDLTVDELKNRYRFENLTEFIQFYLLLYHCFFDEDDFRRVTYEVLRDLVEQNVRYVELKFNPVSHILRGADFEDLKNGIKKGRDEALEEFGIKCNFIFDFPRGIKEAGSQTLRCAIDARSSGVVALDISGDENHFGRYDFSEIFEQARQHGLHTVAHAGEGVPPASIWYAVHNLRAERIGHATTAVDDAGIMEYLKQKGTVLELCPKSNVSLHIVPSLPRHPLKKYLDAGLPITLNCDDPGLFQTSLTEEFLVVADAFDLSLEQMIKINLNSVRYSFMPADEKNKLLAEMDAEIKRLCQEISV